MTQLLLISSSLALVLLMVHSWRTRGRAVTIAFFGAGILFGVIRGNAIWLLCRLLSDNNAAALQPYIPQESIIPPIGHESLQVAVGWVFALYLAWTVSEMILRRLPRFSGRVFMIAGLSALFMGAICWCMETTAVAAGWWYWWALPTRTALFGSVNVAAMEGWFSVVPDFLIPFLVIACAATKHNALKWLWLLAFPLHLLGHLAYKWVPYAYLTYNAMELVVIVLMMFSGLRLARGEMKDKPEDRVSGILFAAALIIFFAVVAAANLAAGAGPEKVLTLLPMLLLCLLAWRRLAVVFFAGISVVCLVAWVWMGPPALWVLAPVAAYAFLKLLERQREAWPLRLVPPVAAIVLTAWSACATEADKVRTSAYADAWVRGDRATFENRPEDAAAAYRQADEDRPRDLTSFYLVIREMMAIDPTDARQAALILQHRMPRITAELEEVVRRDPEWVAPRQDLTNFYLMSGRLADAADQYRAIRRVRRKDADTMVMLGYFLLREGKVEDAERVCEQAMRLKKPPAAAMINLGVIRFSEGRDDEARKLWRQALEAEPGNPIALLNMERPGADAPNREIDMRYFARNAAGVQLASWVNALAAYGAGYSPAERFRLVTEAASLDPASFLPQLNLARTRLDGGPSHDRERALWHARRAVAIARASGDGNDLAQGLLVLGRALLANGKEDEARAALEEGKTKAPARMVPEFERLLDSLKAPGK